MTKNNFERRARTLEREVGVTEDADYVVDLSEEFGLTVMEVLESLPEDLYVNYLIASDVIPDIYDSDFLAEHFNPGWLNKIGK